MKRPEKNRPEKKRLGQPPKPDDKKRHQKQISLYKEQVEKLNKLSKGNARVHSIIIRKLIDEA